MTKANQDFEMVAGESKTIIASVTDKDGLPYGLTGATIIWELQRDIAQSTGADLVKSTANGGIVIADSLGGIFKINLDPADTETLSGHYIHEARITETGGKVSTVFTGRVTVQKTAID